MSKNCSIKSINKRQWQISTVQPVPQSQSFYKNVIIARYHLEVSLKGIRHNSGSIKGFTLETMKKMSNFPLNFQRKFQLVQHCTLKYGTYLEDAVHTVMALVIQILHLSLFWRRIRPTCNKRDEHGVILHTQMYTKSQTGVSYMK